MIRLGPLQLGTMPRVAIALTDTDVRDNAKAVASLVDVFELRIDRFARHDSEYVAQVTGVARSLGVPLLATVRSATEGGEATLSEPERLALLRVVAPWVDALDIELRASICRDVISVGRQHGKPVVVSMHDFAATPPRQALHEIIAASRDAGADIVKVATTVRSRADLALLLDVLATHADQPLIVIGMGPEGLASRIFFPLFGSLLTWGFLNTVGAPGQLPLPELVDELCRYAPDFARRHGR